MVLAIHRRQLAEHGGGEGIRDDGLLTSALNKPRHLYRYGEPTPDLAALAASYAYGLARNHPFVDGNKRTALIVCRLFLKLNGQDLKAPPQDTYRTIMQLASGELTEQALVGWVRVCLG